MTPAAEIDKARNRIALTMRWINMHIITYLVIYALLKYNQAS